MDTFLCLDCQQLKPTQPTGGTGYTTLGDAVPSEAHHVVCYDCANRREHAAFATADRYTAYLASDGRTITTWSGGTLARVTHVSTTHAGFGGRRIYLRAVGPDGARWYGTTPGRGMFVRLRRATGVA